MLILGILWGISRDEVVNRLNNSVLEDEGVLWMDFGANKKLVEVINLSVKISSYLCSQFWGSSSEMHFLGGNFEVHPRSEMHFVREQFWRAPMLWNAIGNNYFSFLTHGCWLVWLCCFILLWLLSLNNYGVRCRTSLRFWENKRWINKIGWWKTNW